MHRQHRGQGATAPASPLRVLCLLPGRLRDIQSTLALTEPHTGSWKPDSTAQGVQEVGQDRTGQGRAGQDRTGQDRTGCTTGQDRTHRKQDSAGHTGSKEGQDGQAKVILAPC